MSASPASPLTPNVLQQAASWLVCIDGQPDDVQLREYNDWLEASELHREAVRQLQASLASLSTLPRAPARAALSSITRKPARLPVKALMLALVLLLPASLVLQRAPAAYWFADIRTGTGQWHTQQLPDGSRIRLNGLSAVDVDFDSHSRTLHLLRGEILVEVTKDAQRPFLVVTDEGSIRALGTRFTVERLGSSTRLAMIESSTHVISAGDGLDVHANQQVMMDAGGVHPLNDVDGPGIEQAWEHHKLVVKRLPLAQVLERLNRFHNGWMMYDATTLANLEVTAILPADDSERALRLLARSLPIKVEKIAPWVTRIALKKP